MVQLGSIFHLSVLLSTLLFLNCQQASLLPTIATLAATIDPSDDVTGVDSLVANINYQEIDDMIRPEATLEIRFENADGAVLEFSLSKKEDTGNPILAFPTGRYEIDGTFNTFHASFPVGSGAQTVDVTSSRGCLDVDEIFWKRDSFGGTLLDGIGGAYKVNFDDGGVGSGLLNWRANSAGATNCL